MCWYKSNCRLTKVNGTQPPADKSLWPRNKHKLLVICALCVTSSAAQLAMNCRSGQRQRGGNEGERQRGGKEGEWGVVGHGTQGNLTICRGNKKFLEGS